MERQNHRKMLLHYMEAFNSYCGHREGDVNSIRIPIFQDDNDQSAEEVSTSPIVEFPDDENEHLGECSDYAIQTVEEDEESHAEVETKLSSDLLNEKNVEEVTTIPILEKPGEEDTFSHPEILDEAFQNIEEVKTVVLSELQERNIVEMQTISSPDIPDAVEHREGEKISLSEFPDEGLEEVTTIPPPEFPDEQNHNLPPFLVQ